MATTEARTAVLDQLTDAFEAHAVEEQLRPGEGEAHHRAGLLILRALDAEERNPQPKGPCRCIQCAALREAGKK